MTRADDMAGPTRMVVQSARKLRFPKLFVLMLVLFLGDLLIPDFIPFFDEIILGLLSLMLGLWREKTQV